MSRVLVCPDCTKRYKREGDYRAHALTHMIGVKRIRFPSTENADGTVICDTCGRTSASIQGHHAHARIHREAKAHTMVDKIIQPTEAVLPAPESNGESPDALLTSQMQTFLKSVVRASEAPPEVLEPVMVNGQNDEEAEKYRMVRSIMDRFYATGGTPLGVLTEIQQVIAL